MEISTEDGQFKKELSLAENGSARVSNLTNKDRELEAIKTALLWLGGTIVMVLVPVFHFVLVPLGAVLTVFFTIKAFKKTHRFNLTGVTCPKCSAVLNEKTVTAEGHVLKVHCYSCRNGLLIDGGSQ